MVVGTVEEVGRENGVSLGGNPPAEFACGRTQAQRAVPDRHAVTRPSGSAARADVNNRNNGRSRCNVA